MWYRQQGCEAPGSGGGWGWLQTIFFVTGALEFASFGALGNGAALWCLSFLICRMGIARVAELVLYKLTSEASLPIWGRVCGSAPSLWEKATNPESGPHTSLLRLLGGCIKVCAPASAHTKNDGY